MSRFDIVAIAASAGGLPALGQILSGLSRDFPASIVIVQHLDPTHRSWMADILGRQTELVVKEAENGEAIKKATAYIAPPDKHLLVTGGKMLSLTDTKQVQWVRPSADILFESVAKSFGNRAIAVVLTGSGKDGARGVTAIKQHGGIVIVQDEKSSQHFGMPSAAIETGLVDYVVPLDEISAKLMALIVGEEIHAN